MSNNNPDKTEPSLYWWAGIASVLPRMSVIPRSGNRWIDKWNDFRRRIKLPPVFPSPNISKEEARSLAKPTSSGFGDMILAWMMPMTVADLMGWKLRIPVPQFAGGTLYDPRRPRLTPEIFHSKLTFPSHVELISAEEIPTNCKWFYTVEQQWFLNSCTETSFDTIPLWLQDQGIGRERYYNRYRQIARALMSPNRDHYFAKGTHFLTLHARRGDKGHPGDEEQMSKLLDNLARDFKHWVVISDDENTRHEIIASLGKRDCSAVSSLEPGLGASTTSAENSIELLFADFKAMVMASGVVCSAPGGWSSFPYAATRISGAPLLFSTDVVNSPVWQLFHDYSKIPIRGTHWGVSGTRDFSKAVEGKTEQSQQPPSI